MPDNVTFQSATPATPPDTTIVAADDVGGIKYQVVKLDVGADGVSAPLSSSNPVPVNDAGGSLTVDYAATGSGTATGALRVELPTNGTGIIATVGAVTAISNALPAGNNNIGDVDIVTMPTVTINSPAVTNAGTFAVQESGAALTALQLIDDPVVQDDNAFTPATTKVMMAGYEADESSTDSVDEGDGGAARMTLDRKQIVTVQGHTAGGLSTFMASGSDGSSILVATAQAIKASAGQLYGYYAYNPEAAVTFVHFYNVAAASVTVGTTNPLFTIQIPAGSAANLALTIGITFSNAGWSCAATTTAGGTGAPATGVSLTVWYM